MQYLPINYISEDVEVKYSNKKSRIGEYYKMKLKVLSSFVALTFIITLFSPQGNAFASTLDQATVQLNKGETSHSTRRITIYGGQDIKINVDPVTFGSRGVIGWTVFRNGVQWKTGATTSAYYVSPKWSATTAQYSLRLYCGVPTNTQTGCYSDGSIMAVPE